MPPASFLSHEYIVQLSQTDWYGICAVITLGLWLGWRLAHRCGHCIVRWHHMHIRRLWCYTLPTLLYQLGIATVREGFLIVLLLTVNILPLVMRAESWMIVCRRAAHLAVMNFTPLWTGLTFGLPAHLLGVKRSTLSWMHRWIGRAVVIHSTLHGAIIILRDDQPARAIRQFYVPFMVKFPLPGVQCSIHRLHGLILTQGRLHVR